MQIRWDVDGRGASLAHAPQIRSWHSLETLLAYSTTSIIELKSYLSATLQATEQYLMRPHSVQATSLSSIRSMQTLHRFCMARTLSCHLQLSLCDKLWRMSAAHSLHAA